MNYEFKRAFWRLQESRGTASWKPLTLKERSKVIDMWMAMGDFSLELEKEGVRAVPGLPMYNAAGMGMMLRTDESSSPAYIFRAVDYPVTCAGGVVYTDYEDYNPDLEALARRMRKRCRLEDSGFDVSIHLETETAPFYPEPDCKYIYRVELEVEDPGQAVELSPEYFRKVLDLLSKSLLYVRSYVKRCAYLDDQQPSFIAPEDAFDEFWYESELYSRRYCIIPKDSCGGFSDLKVYEIEKGSLLVSTEGVSGRWYILAVSDYDRVVRMYDAVDCCDEPADLFAEFVSLTGSMLTRELVDHNDELAGFIVSNVYGLGNYVKMGDEEYKEILSKRIAGEQYKRKQDLEEWLNKISGTML